VNSNEARALAALQASEAENRELHNQISGLISSLGRQQAIIDAFQSDRIEELFSIQPDGDLHA
jgi:hypothetical protein